MKANPTEPKGIDSLTLTNTGQYGAVNGRSWIAYYSDELLAIFAELDEFRLAAKVATPTEDLCSATGDPCNFGIHLTGGEWQCAYCNRLRPLADMRPKVATPEGIGGETLEMELRRLMWLSHGHGGIYGDDGEMQCGECAKYRCWDYKNAPLDEVRNAYNAACLERMNKAMAKNPTPEPRGEPADLMFKTSEEAELLPMPLQILRLKKINAGLCKSFNTLLIENVNLERKAMTKLDPNALPVTELPAKSEEGESAL